MTRRRAAVVSVLVALAMMLLARVLWHFAATLVFGFGALGIIFILAVLL